MTAPIAIVGAAARLPGAPDLEAYWDLLANGRDAVTEIPDARWSKAAYGHPDPGQPGKSYTWAAGVLPDPGAFDSAFFGISPREADQVDPAQRLLLELVWEAMEDGGQRPSRWAGSGAGVFIGASGTEYGNLALGDPAVGNAYFMTGTTTGIAANRISYVFDLHGPSFIMDTACSSSIVALHQACQAIRSGEVPTAIAGGVNMLMTPFPFAGFSAAGMLSPDGRCFAFDARANGYVRSEGGGVVLLKPLDAALADGDAIRAVVRGTGLNSDGRTMGLSLPNGEMQGRLLRHVYDRFEVDPAELGFVEAHGTGTAAGDPIELGALGRELGRRRDRPLRVGSAKTNVGHLEVASGMAGLLKTMLALEHRTAPPSLHFNTPNPDIAFDELNLEVVTRPTPLGDGELTAGVNSFGFGGTNAHAVLSAAPPAREKADAAPSGALPPLLISARSEASLKALAQSWAERLDGAAPGAAARAVRAAARSRDHHRHRAHAWGATPADLAAVLRAPEVEHLRAGWTDSRAVAGRVAFVFTGNGAQFPGMARDALAHSSAFRAAIEEVDAELGPRLGWSVFERLAADEPPEMLARTDVAQPLLFAVQVGVVRALEAAGVRPAAVLGHSVGEIAAAWASGALSLADACRVVEARSRQQQRTAGAGRMAALSIGPEAALDAIAAVGARLELAAENSADATTVAGPAAALARLKEAAEAEGWRCTPLQLDYAFHSAAMDPIRTDLLADLDGLRAGPTRTPFVSTVTGETVDGEALGPDYWWRNIRERVRFASAVEAAIAAGSRVLVEIGPHAILQSYLRQGLKAAEVEGRVLATLAKRAAPRDPFSAIAGRLYAAGADLSDAPAFDGPAARRGLPSYPWARQTHWLPWTSEGHAVTQPPQDGRLLGFREAGEADTWSRMLDVRMEPWLADHALEGQPLLPAAAMAEIALAAARVRFPSADVLEVSDLEILRALPLEPGRPRELRVRLGEDRRLSIESRARLSDEGWSTHAVARIGEGEGAAAVPLMDLEAAVARLEGEAVYAAARRLGLDYGPAFQPVEHVDVQGADAAQVRLRPDAPVADGQMLATELLDGAFQGFLALLLSQGEGAGGDSLLPARMGRVRLHAPFDRRPVEARLQVRRRGVRSVMGEVVLLDGEGAVVAEVREAWFRRVRLRAAPDADDRTFRFDRLPAPLAEGAAWAPEPAALLQAAIDSDAGATGDGGEAAALLEAYLVAAAHGALTEVIGSGVTTAAEIVERVHADAAPLAFAALELLSRHGLASETAGLWTLASGHGFGDRSAIWRTLFEEQPALTAELALAADTAALLPRILREGSVAGRAPAALLDQLLNGSPAARRAQDALSAALLRLAAIRPQGRPFRVLELGAGTGALTRHLLRLLSPHREAVRYLATDPDADVAARLALSLAREPGAAALAWSPGEGGADPEDRFDVVVSAGALTRSGRAALSAVRRVLAPGGVLLAAEPQPSALLDLVLGRAPAWWAASLTPELPVSPLRPGSAWAAALSDAGFSQVESTDLAASPWANTLLAATAIAEAPAVIELCAQTTSLRLLGDAEGPLGRALAEGAAIDDGAADAVWLAPAGDPTVRSAALLDAVRALAALEAAPPRLWIVVRGADEEPAEAVLLGLARTLANEHPELQPRAVDLAPDLAAGEAADRLRAEIAAADAGETEVVHTAAGRFVPRLRRGAPPTDPAPGAPRALDAAQPGLLSSLRWAPASGHAPGVGEVAIRVEASGLNFRDVMWAQGLLPEEALLDGFAGATLGLECAGIVTAVGDGVELRPGDRVMAFAPAALASEVVTAAHAVVRLPERLTFAEAATVPVAFLTVVYALGHVARLERGERVLIHGAAGGVGLAAVQYAQARGAEVFATAGSHAKREVLRQLGCDHVLDSRSLAFAEEVRRLTDGAGVDVVLNSLAGEAMERSLALLSPFGRFLELGKRDFFENTRVGLRPLRENVSYHAIDADRLPLARPELAARLLAETLAMMEAGELRPLPFRAFPRPEVEDAFRLMQGAGHIGKIVVTPAARSVEAPAARPFTVRDDRIYLVTGGLGGFGLESARWLAKRGARRLALLGRRGPATPGSAEALAALAAAGVDTRAYACDVADAAALSAVLDEVRDGQGALGGWVHAAMAVDDGLLRDMDAARLATTFGPKLDGALNLDRLTAGDDLDWALLFSSATTVLGAPGQGPYVAANLALEALAARRSAQGRPTLAVGWGPIADAGFLHREGAALDALERRLSAAPLVAGEALDALPALWASGRPALTYAAVHWDAARKRLPILSRPLFADVAAGDADEDTDLAERLAGLEPAEAKALVVDLLLEEVARILSAGEKVDAHRPLAELGMDSLMAVELRMTLESKLKVNLPLLSLSETATVGSLAGRITASLLEARGDGAAPSALAEAARVHETEALAPAAARPEATAAE